MPDLRGMIQRAGRTRNYQAEYARRVERGLAAGFSRSQARGHARTVRGEVPITVAKVLQWIDRPSAAAPRQPRLPGGTLRHGDATVDRAAFISQMIVGIRRQYGVETKAGGGERKSGVVGTFANASDAADVVFSVVTGARDIGANLSWTKITTKVNPNGTATVYAQWAKGARYSAKAVPGAVPASEWLDEWGISTAAQDAEDEEDDLRPGFDDYEDEEEEF